MASSETSQVASDMQNFLTLLVADSDDKAAVLPPDEETGVLGENMQCAHHHTCFVRAKALLAPANLPKFGRMCWIHEKTVKIDCFCHYVTLTDRRKNMVFASGG